MTTDATVQRARDLFEQQAWGEAYEVLRAADAEAQLAADDLERLAVATYLTGHDDDACDTWGRAHRAYLRVDDGLAAVRCAFWLGCVLILTGQLAPAHGWFARTQHLLDKGQRGPVETGYLDIAAGLETLFSGDPVAAHPRLAAAATAGSQHGEPDLAALGRLGSGQALIMMGRPADGVAMLDEAMVAVSAGEVSPVATGLIYCAVIDTCQELFDLRRAQEWTTALGDWCGAQPDLVPYRGQCLVHRAQLMRINGAWADALAEAEQASRRLSEPFHPALGAALYEQAELYRLRGDDQAAGDAYRRASDAGHGVQPGLALLRLRQGRVGSAAAAIERTLAEPQFPAQRARLLAARVEIQLAAGDVRGRPRREPTGLPRCRNSWAPHRCSPAWRTTRRASCSAPRGIRGLRCGPCARRGRRGRRSTRPTSRPGPGCGSGLSAVTLATRRRPRWSSRPPCSHLPVSAPDPTLLPSTSCCTRPGHRAA